MQARVSVERQRIKPSCRSGGSCRLRQPRLSHDPLGSRASRRNGQRDQVWVPRKCNIRARVELGDAVKPDLCCRLMTGHDLIGRRRHSRVSVVPPERSRAENVHEHTDARSALERGGDFWRSWESSEKRGRTGKSHIPSAMSFGDVVPVPPAACPRRNDIK